MPFLTGLSRALPAATLFVALVAGQTCYFPDQQTISTDVPCNPNAAASSCCSADSFCLDNGLCYGDGIVSRGSCTDQTWGSEACAGYCKTDSPSTGIAITPCSTSTDGDLFVCGLNNTDCQADSNTFAISGGAILLRPSQVAAIIESAVQSTSTASATASSTATGASTSACASANTSSGYSGGAMAGVAIGVGLPLALAFCGAIMLLRKEKRRNSGARPRQMYDKPDDEYEFKPPPPLRHQASFAPSLPASGTVSIAGSRRGSFSRTESPARMPDKWIARYGSTGKRSQVQELDLGVPRHELDSAPPYQPPERHELGDRRGSS